VTLVSVDFDSQALEGALQQAGYSGEEQVFFIWEGVTQYVSETAVREIFEFLRTAAPGSQLVFTYIRKDFIAGKQMYRLELLHNRVLVKKQLWQFGFEPEAIGAFLGQHSWQEIEQAGSSEYQERYLEPINRDLLVMEIERAVHARRMAHQSGSSGKRANTA
jgi:methyltransferase (TIGR00027 family)